MTQRSLITISHPAIQRWDKWGSYAINLLINIPPKKCFQPLIASEAGGCDKVENRHYKLTHIESSEVRSLAIARRYLNIW